MDEATLKRATEPFFTTKGIGRGSGLGLSMVHGLSEQSGGKLRLISKPGAGTTVELYLPAIDPAAPVPVISPAIGDHSAAFEWGQPLSVLVVDDDPLVLVNTSAILEDLGHSAVAVESGALALAQLAQKPFDVLLTDHAMPHMTGAQLVREIGERYPEMAVLIASGFAELPEDMNHIPRLKKPYTQDELAQALVKCRNNTAQKLPAGWPHSGAAMLKPPRPGL